MGEWSEYFEDFPEEDPGNYDERGNYDPDRRLRAEAERQRLAHRKLDETLRSKPWSSGKSGSGAQWNR
jgi:hypothetical protein